jgi:hypothetical protein
MKIPVTTMGLEGIIDLVGTMVEGWVVVFLSLLKIFIE